MAVPSRTVMSLRSYGGRVSRHAHAHAQVVLPVAGALEMRVGLVPGRVTAGRGVLVGAGMEHEFSAQGDNRFVVLDLPAADGLPAAEPFFAVDAALGGLVGYLSAEAAEGALDAAAAAHAAALLTAAIRRRTSPAAAEDGPVARAIALMRARAAEPLTVADLAGAVGLASSRFHERFRAETGRTPAAYLTDLRLDLAEALLRAGDLPLAEVALAAGFADQSAFTRCFKRRRGVPPGVLRRR